MVQFLLTILLTLRVFFRSRADNALEILALRQQVAVLKRKRPRPRLNICDRLFWSALRRIWPGVDQCAHHRQASNGHWLA